MYIGGLGIRGNWVSQCVTSQAFTRSSPTASDVFGMVKSQWCVSWSFNKLYKQILQLWGTWRFLSAVSGSNFEQVEKKFLFHPMFFSNKISVFKQTEALRCHLSSKLNPTRTQGYSWLWDEITWRKSEPFCLTSLPNSPSKSGTGSKTCSSHGTVELCDCNKNYSIIKKGETFLSWA